MITVFRDLTDDLFAGDAKLFFSHRRLRRKSPVRIETSVVPKYDCEAISLTVHVADSDMILLIDSRMNASRVVRSLRASDIGADSDVSAMYDPENVRRWSNLERTSDGRHWSDGELINGKRKTERIDASRNEDSALARLNAQLPPFAIEAVRGGRAIVISRVKNLLQHDSQNVAPNGKGDLRVHKLCKSFGNHVYSLCRDGVDGENDPRVKSDRSVAVLIIGRFWPKETSTDANALQPALTVARKRTTNASKGGRVFCICLGNHLKNSLIGLSPEDVAKSKRHYEGYYDKEECASLTDEKQNVVTIS